MPGMVFVPSPALSTKFLQEFFVVFSFNLCYAEDIEIHPAISDEQE
jgi:hypothetical protein